MVQTLVIGAIHGLTIALLAVGIVLVYKANRFINLAHTHDTWWAGHFQEGCSRYKIRAPQRYPTDG